MKHRPSDNVVIVTGAGKGSGEGIAKRLGNAGAKVIVNDINPDRAERVAAEIRSQGGEAMGITADVSNKFQCVHLVESTRANWGRLDILINSAHVKPSASVLKMDEWDWDRCLNVNLKGVFFMSQLCGRVMADENGQRGGVIVNILSDISRPMPEAYRAAVHAGRAGVMGFARECAREFRQHGIRVYTVAQNGPVLERADDETSSSGVTIDGWKGELSQTTDLVGIVSMLCTEK